MIKAGQEWLLSNNETGVVLFVDPRENNPHPVIVRTGSSQKPFTREGKAFLDIHKNLYLKELVKDAE